MVKVPRESPYQGLTPYDEDDAAYFFGREQETKLIAASLFASPLTLLYGASGVGKSSILRAGVVNRLRGRKDVLVVVFTKWQTNPLKELKHSLAYKSIPLMIKKVRLPPPIFRLRTKSERIELLAYRARKARRKATQEYSGPVGLEEFVRTCSELTGRRLMIILDQFEEYSLYHPEDDPFALELPNAITAGNLSASYLLSMREDALAQLDRFEGRIPTLFNNFRRVNHLDRNAARRAITEPIARYNQARKRSSKPVSIEPNLIKRVLDQVRTGQVLDSDIGGAGTITRTSIQQEREGRIETPYLQLVMTRLWNEEIKQGSRTLRSTTLTQLGGAQRIVLTHLDAVMAEFSDNEKELAASIFNLLVTPSGTKIAHMVRDLADYAGVGSAELKPLLERLSQGSDRILRPVAPLPDYPREARYEIFHDRLGAAILDWRSRYQHEQELLKAKLQEADQRRFSQSYVDKLMSKLDARELELAAEALKYLVSPSGAKIFLRLKELEGFLDVTTSELEPIMQRLTAEDDGILSQMHVPDGPNRYHLRHDALAPAVLSWRAGYVAEQKRREESSALDRDALAISSRREVPGVLPPAAPKDPAYLSISDLLHRGRIVTFVGPGVSASARASTSERWHEDASFLPTGAELTRYLASLVEFPYDAGSDLASLEVVTSYVEAMAGRSFLNKHLHRVLANSAAQPSATARYLADVARLQPLVVVTSNYDDLLEQAFDQANVVYDLLINGSDSDPRGSLLWRSHQAKHAEPVSSTSIPDFKSRCVIYKLCGSIDRENEEQSTFVITDLDYLDGFLQRVTAQGSFIAARISQKNALLLGWSLRAWHHRGFLRSLLRLGTVRLPKNWSILFQPSPLEQAFCAQMNVKIFNQELNEFVARMREVESTST